PRAWCPGAFLVLAVRRAAIMNRTNQEEPPSEDPLGDPPRAGGARGSLSSLQRGTQRKLDGRELSPSKFAANRGQVPALDKRPRHGAASVGAVRHADAALSAAGWRDDSLRGTRCCAGDNLRRTQRCPRKRIVSPPIVRRHELASPWQGT